MAKKAEKVQEWFDPFPDWFPQNDDAAATAWVADSLAGDIGVFMVIGGEHDDLIRQIVRCFNRDLRELGQLLNRNGDKLARKQYQPKGVEIGKWIGRTFAELSWMIGRSVKRDLLLHTDVIGFNSMFKDGSKFVAVDPDAVVNKWAEIQKWLKKSLDQADLQRLNVALENEQQRVEVKPDATAGWPTLSPDDLRKLFGIKQDALKRRLKSQAITNVFITTKAYRVDPSALPDDWKRTLKRG